MSIARFTFAFLLLFLPVLSLAADPKVYYWSNLNDDFLLVDFSQASFEQLFKKEFNAREKTIVLIHGFAENIHRGMYRDFARRVKQFEPKTNILGIDWFDSQNNSWIPGNDPVSASSVIPEVAKKAYDLLFSYNPDKINLCAQNSHIIGFSHGAHIAALIGKRAGGCIAHLTFLDPSPAKSHLFTWENFLGSGWTVEQSARFSDMYKSSNWASTSSARGHVSFYVWENGVKPKENLTNTDEIFKNHYYAFHWYLSTIGKKYNDFGYSIEIPVQKIQPQPFSVINSNLPKKYNPTKQDNQNEYNEKDYNKAQSWLGELSTDSPHKKSSKTSLRSLIPVYYK